MPHPTLIKPQTGFNLIELMVASIIGMLTIAGIITFFVKTVHSNSDGLNEIRLNQELRALMDVMARDIRRSGYWRNADGVTPNIYASGAHSLTVVNKDCITFSYDNYKASDSNPDVVQNSDATGFRLLNGTIKFRRNSSFCNKTTNWIALSDSDTVKITKLEFNIRPLCHNISSPLTPITKQRGCGESDNLLPPAEDDTLSITNIVTIKLSGELKADRKISAIDMTETVLVRNSTAI